MTDFSTLSAGPVNPVIRKEQNSNSAHCHHNFNVLVTEAFL